MQCSRLAQSEEGAHAMNGGTMTRGLGGTAPANVQSYLKGVHYPAAKKDLISAARKNHAPPEIVELLEKLPEDQFHGPQEMMKAYGALEPERRKTGT
jgi:Protein of unknown function (DUF2795)